jgi:hypothetical protein
MTMCGCDEPKISLKGQLDAVGEQLFAAQGRLRDGMVALVQSRQALEAIAAPMEAETAPPAAPEPVSPPGGTIWVPYAVLADALKRLEAMEARFEAMQRPWEWKGTMPPFVYTHEFPEGLRR